MVITKENKEIFMQEKKIEINNVESSSHEEIQKAGYVAAVILATIVNAAEIQAGYEAGAIPDTTTEQIAPKNKEEKLVAADPLLYPNMTQEQIDSVAKAAVEKFEMNKAFENILHECDALVKAQKGTESAVNMCVDWYKAEALKGNGKAALEIILQNHKEITQNKHDLVGSSIMNKFATVLVGLSVVGTLMKKSASLNKTLPKDKDEDFSIESYWKNSAK